MRLSWIVLIVFVLEIWLLITWGAELGLLGTLLEFIISAMFGFYLIRTQSISLLTRVNQEVRMGQTPQYEVVPNLLTIIASVLLIVPGFLTDMIACVLLLPWIRGKLLQKVWLGLQKNAKRNSHRGPITIDQKDD